MDKHFLRDLPAIHVLPPGLLVRSGINAALGVIERDIAKRRIRGHFLICYLALVMHRLLEKEMVEKGLSLTAERIIDALAVAELQEVVLPSGEAIYTKAKTGGDFDAIFKELEFGKLPRIGKAADIKRALKVREL